MCRIINSSPRKRILIKLSKCLLGVFWRHPKRILKHFVGLVALAQIVEILLVGQTPKGIHYLRQLRSSDGRTDGVERRKKTGYCCLFHSHGCSRTTLTRGWLKFREAIIDDNEGIHIDCIALFMRGGKEYRRIKGKQSSHLHLKSFTPPSLMTSW